MLKISQILILGIVILFSSCGTIIKNNDEVIIIDSKVRVKEITNKDNIIIGITPLFHSIEKNRNQKFYLVEPHKKLEVDYKCHYDLSESIVPNLIATAVMFPFGAISFGVD